ncbi:MFS transporter [Spirillospora sp. NBC_00431]
MTAVLAKPSTVQSTNWLWNRDFTLYFGARTVSLLGDSMMQVAAALAVGAIYGVAGVGYVLATLTSSFVAVVLFGGVFADRIGVRKTMVGADIVRVVTQTTVAVAFFAGGPPLWLLLTCAFFAGAAAANFEPGKNGMIPLVATDLQRANATLKIADAAAQLGGPVVAGVIMTLGGAAVAYSLNAATFAFSGICLALLRIRPVAKRETASSVLRDLRRGWTEFRSRSWMWSVILIWVFFGLLVFGPYVPLGSRTIGDRLGDAAYGWAMAGLGAGTVIGGLTAIRLRPRRPLAAGAAAMFGFGFIPLAAALPIPLPLVVAGNVIGGVAFAFWSVMWATSIQTNVSYDVLNRVTAYEISGSVCGAALGQALVGPVSQFVSPRDLLYGSAVASLCVPIALLLARPVRDLRRVESPHP